MSPTIAYTTGMLLCVRMYVCIHVCGVYLAMRKSHTYTHKSWRRAAHTHIPPDTHTPYTHTHTYTHTHIPTHTSVRTHTIPTCTHTYTHILTCLHLPTYLCVSSYVYLGYPYVRISAHTHYIRTACHLNVLSCVV